MLKNKGSHFISKGDGSCGLNVHNSGAHLVEYVEGWGPLWAWSTFGFEDMNGTIMDLTHGTRNVCRQVPIRIILYLSLSCVFAVISHKKSMLDLKNVVSGINILISITTGRTYSVLPESNSIGYYSAVPCPFYCNSYPPS